MVGPAFVEVPRVVSKQVVRQRVDVRPGCDVARQVCERGLVGLVAPRDLLLFVGRLQRSQHHHFFCFADRSRRYNSTARPYQSLLIDATRYVLCIYEVLKRCWQK